MPTAPNPPAGSSAEEVAVFYIDWWIDTIAEARTTIKGWALGAMFTSIGGSGVVAVLGAVSAIVANSLPVAILGAVTTGISASVAVVVAWEAHYSARSLWMLRSEVLNRLGELKRDIVMDLASGSLVPKAALAKLRTITSYYNDEWQALRARSN